MAFSLAYAVKTPKWNAPDEPAHFNYIKHLATTATLPVLQPGDYDQEYLSKLTTAKFPDSLPVDSLRYASHHPPLYYILAAPVYRLSEGLGLDSQVLVLRGMSILYGTVLLLVCFALIGEVLPSQRLIALGTTAFAAGVPMHVAMTAAVNNDTLAELVLTAALLVSVRGLRRGFSYRRSAILGALLGLALLTKTTIYAALPLAFVALWARSYALTPARQATRARGRSFAGALEWAGGEPAGEAAAPAMASHEGVGTVPREGDEPSFARQVLLVYGMAFAVSAWWFLRNMLTYGWQDPFGLLRHDAVVVGQPRTVFSWAALEYWLTTTFQSFWAQFGWMGIVVDRRLYLALAALTALSALGLAVFLFRVKRDPNRLLVPERWTLVLMALCWLFVLGEFVFYNLNFIQAQGRYLFPAIAPIGLFFTLGLLQLVPTALAPLAVLGLYAGLLALDYLCLARFIAPFFGT